MACIVNHGMGVDWQEQVLRRLLDEQLLFASSTTEGMGGGNVRSSASAIRHHEGRISLDRDASVISYGAYADGVVTTARRLHLHLPATWPWAAAFTHLFEATCGPPPAPAT